MARVPCFIQEQNSVAGMVNRSFFKIARKVFLGFPLAQGKNAGSKFMITGVPVRVNPANYGRFSYPNGFDANKNTILICGGSQGAQSMNVGLVKPVQSLLAQGRQVVWQTGNAGYAETVGACGPHAALFVFQGIDDLYPYYGASKAVVCRAGASTLAEIAYFGLPCVMVPLPWAAENHQWTNAGVVESQGWGIRVKQDEKCGDRVEEALARIIQDTATYETMCARARANSPLSAARIIAETIIKEIRQ
jgi:UDP-N-acetylglucosamine--N-acetylmuramyl-(pentapeptide) pyrophosphoryl-undecaprenol N-acetylglucosamine transferase